MKKEETNSYKGWLNSDSFIKRVIGVTLYQWLGSLILSILMIIPIILLVIAFGIYKFDYLASLPGYDVDGNKIVNIDEREAFNDEDVVICDENWNRYSSEEEARKTGLKDAQFGATYCPDYDAKDWKSFNSLSDEEKKKVIEMGGSLKENN